MIDGIQRGLTENAIDPADVVAAVARHHRRDQRLLEHKGARCGFIATRGFRDLLELRRSSRPDLYDLFQDGPNVLVPRRYRWEITERIDAQGDVVTPLATAEIPALIDAIAPPACRRSPCRSCSPSLTTATNAPSAPRCGQPCRMSGSSCPAKCCRKSASSSAPAPPRSAPMSDPLLASYLDRLSKATAALGLPALHVMGSSGGVFDIAEGLRMPAMAVESGPAAGVIAAALAGRQLGRPNLISFDMGGTTAKASVIVNHEVAVTAEYEVGGAANTKRWMHGTGHPIRVPVIDLAEVSAGGGSIAWIDPGGALKVGPGSAGADPGPAAYGRGGRQPTVTDADVVLGWLDRQALLGGALPIDLDAAQLAIETAIAKPFGLSVRDAAARIIEVVNSNMAQALRIVSVERGHDPREFSLIAFGGAGPVHAVALAEELAIPEVIIPPAPGAFSALGLVATNLKRDYARTLYANLATVDPARVDAAFTAMASRRRCHAGSRVGPRHPARPAKVRRRPLPPPGL